MRTTRFLSFLALLCTLLASNAFADRPRLVIDTGGHTAKIRDIVFTHDGSYLVSAGYDKVVRVWDVQTGQTVRTIRGEIGDGPAGGIYAIALSPVNRYLAVGGRLAGGRKEDINAIRIHDFQDFRAGTVLRLLRGHKDKVADLAFSSNGLLASGSADETVRIWDVEKGEELQVLIGHKGPVNAVAFSPDGLRVISGSWDHTLRLWDVKRGKPIRVMENHEGQIFSVAFSPDGHYIASGSEDKTIRLWDTKTGDFLKILGRQDATVTSLSFSVDGRQLLTGAGWGGGYHCHVFSVPSGEIQTRFTKHNNIVLATAISPDGRMAATAGGDNKEIYLWDPQTGQIIRKLAGQGRNIWSVGFAQDGRSIAYGNEYNLKASDHYLGPLQRAVLLKRDGDSEFALGGKVKDTSAYIQALTQHESYELRTKEGSSGYQAVLQVVRGGEVLHEIERDVTSGFRHRSYTFTHDGKYIATAGSNGVLALYSSETSKGIREFVGHTGDVFAIAVSADDRTLVSGSSDQTVRLWDMESGKNLLTLFVGSDGEWVAWTPEGYYTSSPHGDKYISWHLNHGVDRAAEYYGADRFVKTLFRPDVVAEYLQVRDIELALKRANEKKGEEYASQPVGVSPDIRNILPPLVFVTSPEGPEIKVKKNSLSVEAVIQSHTLPITQVEVLLNGTQVKDFHPGRFKKRLGLELTLREGENTLEIIASHDKANSAPEIRKIFYEPVTPSPELKPTLILLAIGISKYHDNTLRLDYADADASEVVKLFEEPSKRPEPKVSREQLFQTVKTKLLQNKEATRAQIIEGLKWLREAGTEKDTRVLFLSGHGDKDPRGDYFFLAYEHEAGDDPELSGVPWSSLLTVLVPGKGILLVDTCRAGAVGEDVDFTRVLKKIHSEYMGLVTFAASTGRESSIEKKEWGHGAFTKALIEGLFFGQADGFGAKKDHVISTHELGSWIRQRVGDLTDGQQHAHYYAVPPTLQPFPIYTMYTYPSSAQTIDNR